MKPTTEELALQIFATCMLINSQGAWLANLHCSGHVSEIYVVMYPIEYWDTPEDERPAPGSTPRMSAYFAGARSTWLTEEEGHENLQRLLTWVQGFLDLGQEKEATPCAA